MRTISIIGITTDDNTASVVTIENESPVASILSGELLIALHAHDSFKVLNETGRDDDRTMFAVVKDGEGTDTGAGTDDVIAIGVPSTVTASSDFFVPSSSKKVIKKLTVVTVTPANDGEIQLTDVNKFKLYLSTGMTESDALILKVAVVGEIMRP